MKILVTGATGFIGTKLCEELSLKGYSIIALTRSKKKYDNKSVFSTVSNISFIESLEEIKSNDKIDAVVNLAGENIAAKRWSEKQKAELVNSRINTTKNIIKLIERLEKKPEVLLSASAIGYYGSQGEDAITETSKPVEEFTHSLCKKWEDEAKNAEAQNVRTCIMRFGVVLGKDGGTISKLKPPFSLGLGGVIGSGEQYFSWVHIEDVIEGILFLLSNKKLNGVFNFTAPSPLNNKAFTKAMGKAVNRPTIFPMPEFIVKILFGEMGETLLLKGQRVYPKRLLDEGYKFKYDNIEAALEEIFSNND